MARKNVLLHFKMLDAADISTTQTSPATDIAYLDNAGIVITWSGTSPVGTIDIECANPAPTEHEADWTWVPLNFGSVISVSGNTGLHTITMNQLPFTKIRLIYTATSGTGTLTAMLSVKQVGG